MIDAEKQRYQLKLLAKMQKIFGLSQCREMFVVDKNLTGIFGCMMFDIFHFERWCIDEGMRDNESMSDFVMRRYGYNTSWWVKELFCGKAMR